MDGGCCALVEGTGGGSPVRESENLSAPAPGSPVPSFAISLLPALGALETWATSLVKCRSAKWRDQLLSGRADELDRYPKAAG